MKRRKPDSSKILNNSVGSQVQEDDSIEGTEWGVGNKILRAQLFPILYIEYRVSLSKHVKVLLFYPRRPIAFVSDAATQSKIPL